MSFYTLFLHRGRGKLWPLSLNSIEQLLIVSGKRWWRQCYVMIHNSSLNITHSARNLGFIFDEHLTFSDQISSVSKSCYYHIRQLRCIRPYLDFSNSPPPTDPELSRSCCCQGSQNISYHSHPALSSLAQNNRTHWIQTPVTYLQSSYNHPTILSA